MGAKRGKPRIVLQLLYIVEAFRDGLPEVSKRFIRLTQLRAGDGSQIPASRLVWPSLDDFREVRRGLVPLPEGEVGVAAMEPVCVPVGSQMNRLGEVGGGLGPLPPAEADKRSAGPGLPGIRRQLDGFRGLGGGFVPLGGPGVQIREGSAVGGEGRPQLLLVSRINWECASEFI